MKKYLLLLLISTSFSYGQTTLANKLRITGNTTDNTATKVNVQATDGTVNTISKVDLQDAFYFASASNFPVTGITDKLYIARDNNILYRFNGTIYVPLTKTNDLDAANIDFTGLGDSITFGQGSTSGNTSYLDIINGILGFKTYTKLAVSSTSAMPKAGQPELFTQVLSIPAGTDLITVMIGVNDYFYGNALGDVQTVLNKNYASLDKTSSFTEALRYNLETIRINHPNTKVIFITPIRTVNTALSAVSPLINYVNNAVAIANYLNIPVVNAYNNSGIYDGNASSFIPDTVHPNDAGYTLISKLVLSNLISNNQEAYTGYLKQDKLTNPITGTGTTNFIPTFTGATSLGNSKAFFDGNGLNYKETDPNSYSSFTAFNNDGTSALQLGVYNTLNANANKAFLFLGGGITELGVFTNGNKFSFFNNGNFNVPNTITASNYNGGADLTGTPTAPTPTAGSAGTQIANKDYVLANGSANAVLLTGNQTITGAKTFDAIANFKTAFMASNTTATTLYVDNFSSGNGIVGRNFAGGNFALCESTGTGNGFVSNVPTSGSGFNFVGQNNEINTFTVNKFGFITASNLPIQLKDFFTDANNTGTTETDLYSYTTLANRLNATGEKLVAVYAGTFNDATASSQIKVVYGGQTIGDTGALTMSVTGAWIVNSSIMRTGATTARAMVSISTPGASTASYTKYTSLTGLTFTGTNILKITGTAGGATGGNDDITAAYGNILWQPAAL